MEQVPAPGMASSRGWLATRAAHLEGLSRLDHGVSRVNAALDVSAHSPFGVLTFSAVALLNHASYDRLV